MAWVLLGDGGQWGRAHLAFPLQDFPTDLGNQHQTLRCIKLGVLGNWPFNMPGNTHVCCGKMRWPRLPRPHDGISSLELPSAVRGQRKRGLATGAEDVMRLRVRQGTSGLEHLKPGLGVVTSTCKLSMIVAGFRDPCTDYHWPTALVVND